MISEDMLTKLLEEISTIRQLLEMLARKALKEELERLATTNERKKIWALCDGLRSTKEIAEEVGITQRTVQRFIKELQEADLIIIEKRGYPKRRFNYVPSDWKIEV